MVTISNPYRYAGILVFSVFLSNSLEFIVGSFPGYGPLVTFVMAGLGVVAVLSSLVILSFQNISTKISTSLFKFGVTLLVGYVPIYLTFGCVFYGCPG